MAVPLTLSGIVRLLERTKTSSTIDSMTGCVW